MCSGVSLRVEDLDDRVGPMLNAATGYEKWERCSSVTEDSRFLGALVYGATISDDDLKRFAMVVDWLVAQGVLEPRRLAPVIGLSLAPLLGKRQRWALLLYGYSKVPQTSINEMLGHPMIIDEGSLPTEGWPEWVNQLVAKVGIAEAVSPVR